MKTFIVIDVNFLCHRAFHALPAMSHEGQGTSVVYGVLRDIYKLRSTLQSEDLVFCFDVGRSRRRRIYGQYTRKRRSPDEKRQRKELYRQIEWLRSGK